MKAVYDVAKAHPEELEARKKVRMEELGISEIEGQEELELNDTKISD